MRVVGYRVRFYGRRMGFPKLFFAEVFMTIVKAFTIVMNAFTIPDTA